MDDEVKICDKNTLVITKTVDEYISREELQSQLNDAERMINDGTEKKKKVQALMDMLPNE